uniref:PsbP C-terminal domain-containing protein n=1 Tax=Erythrolobus madagascarensis TaxID=708628 RepID=A0A7S0XME8_9RHOD
MVVGKESGGEEYMSHAMTRRTMLRLAGALVAVSAVRFGSDDRGMVHAEEAAPVVQQEFTRYQGPLGLGYSFEYPTGWSVGKKTVKTHMNELVMSPAKKSEGAVRGGGGIVVDPVKINSVSEFGSADAVGNRVIELEKKKDGVSSASLVSAKELQKDGLTYYELEYVIDTSHGGEKHFLAASTITGKNLYVLTTQARTADFNASEPALRHVISSFRVKPQYYTP